MLDIIIGILDQGFIYGIMALGVYMTYRILDFPDLSVDGSFPLGAAVSAILITVGVNPWLSLVVALLSGMLAGLVTGLIHVRFHVRDLLAGIITMTALYTINLRIAGSANLPLFDKTTIFNSGLASYIPERYVTLVVSGILLILCKLILDWYFTTKSGFLLRATGDNPHLVTSLGKNLGKVKILGLMISNAMVAFAGAILAQQQRFFEVTMGIGTIMIGLAAVIIGMNLFKGNWLKGTTTAIIGSIAYKSCIAGAIAIGIETTDMKLITAILFLLVLAFQTKQKKVKKGGVKGA